LEEEKSLNLTSKKINGADANEVINKIAKAKFERYSKKRFYKAE
jgi:hypothetical protein